MQVALGVAVRGRLTTGVHPRSRLLIFARMAKGHGILYGPQRPPKNVGILTSASEAHDKGDSRLLPIWSVRPLF